ncbi:endonuclease III [Brachybacterium muris]|uniref:endonuclease III domain-containing protein n=1 Tax=Brachybacterium muris TaxID=219301 RepID=UPI00223B3168|nr:endonuclease III [Brachybacterium muris]MCT2262030.1 endonuclease III [Brachybacterium muris]MCT2295183.1 endonuclease III [Brachybacterium muris]
MTTPGTTATHGDRGPADVIEVDDRLGRTYPGARTELDHRDAFELLVATVLSAQTTDVRVNSLTPELFSRWPDAAALAGADEEQVTALLRPLGMGGTRAARIIGLAQGLLRDHSGQVPDDQQALEALPGVGRKTAYVVRGTWFGHSLLAVDTHVARLSRRLGWTGSKDPVKVETDVVALVEQAATGSHGKGGSEEIDLTALHLRLILHGRSVCLARAPQCGTCVLADICPSAEVA